MKKRLLVWSVFLPVTFAGVFFLWWPSPNPHVTNETAAKIKPGMTEREVVALFGEEGRPFDFAFVGEIYQGLKLGEGELLAPAGVGFHLNEDELERYGIDKMRGEPYCNAWVG